MAENQLAAGHAKALLGTPDRAFQEALAKRIVAEGLSVREAEEAVRPAQRGRRGAGEDAEPTPAPAARAGAAAGACAARACSSSRSCSPTTSTPG